MNFFNYPNLYHVDTINSTDQYTGENVMFIGTGTKWHNDYIHKGKNTYDYIVRTVNRVVDKYNKYLNCINNNNTDHQSILKAELLCDCMFCLDKESDEDKSDTTTDVCHGQIISGIIGIVKRVDKLHRSDIIGTNNEHRAKKILKYISFGDKINDPIIALGDTIHDRYRVCRVLSEGSSGMIFCGEDLKFDKKKHPERTHDRVIIKISKCKESSSDQHLEEYEFIKQLNDIKNKNRSIKEDDDVAFPVLVDFFLIPAPSWGLLRYHHVMVLERYGDDLYDIAVGSNATVKRGLDLFQIQEIAKQMLKTVRVIHRELNIMHNDIKPSNVLVRSQNEDSFKVVIIDFGLCVKIVPKMSRLCFSGTRAYLSPEELWNIGHDTASEVWTIGISLFEIYKGMHLFSNNTPRTYAILSKIFPDMPNTYNRYIMDKSDYKKVSKYSNNETKDRFGVPYNKDYFRNSIKHKQFRDFMLKCLDPNKDTRPGLTEILDHPFLKIDPDKLKGEKGGEKEKE